jgi:hypothetical protein
MPEETLNGLCADSEFERIIQPFSENTISKILETYKEDPQKKPTVYAWENTLLSSAFLYQKIIDAGMDYEVKYMDFDSKYDAIYFICLQQLKRKDLKDSYYKYTIGKAYITEHIKANIDKSVSKFRSAMKLAEPLQISSGTVLKYYEYTKAIDAVYDAEPKLADYILNESVRISHKNTLELARIPRDNLRRLLSSIENDGLKWITYADMRYETHYNPPKGLKPSRIERNETSDGKLAIRQLPAYDPDAQVSSLALTIPSWASSIKRVTDATDFSKISNAARNRLMRNLAHLSNSIEIIRQAIEEE